MYEPIKKSGSLTKSHFIVIHLRPNVHADRHNGGYAERIQMGYRWEYRRTYRWKHMIIKKLMITHIFFNMRCYNQSCIIKKGQILTNLIISENLAYFADNAYHIDKHSFE